MKPIQTRLYSAALPLLPILFHIAPARIDLGRAAKEGIIWGVGALALYGIAALIGRLQKKRRNDKDNESR